LPEGRSGGGGVSEVATGADSPAACQPHFPHELAPSDSAVPHVGQACVLTCRSP